MNMEEDAMLVATGQMSMDEAREKWSDEWADFCKALTRWKSVYQLFRLARANAIKIKLAEAIENSQTKAAILEDLYAEKAEIHENTDSIVEGIAQTIVGIENARDAQRDIGKPAETFFDIPTSKYEIEDIAMDFTGTKNPTAAQWANAIAEQKLQQAEFGQMSEEEQKELNDVKARIAQRQTELDMLKSKQRELNDRFNIVRDYAMGLLVADVFYSLAAALQGGIY